MNNSTPLKEQVDVLRQEVTQLNDIIRKIQSTSDFKHQIEEYQRADMLARIQRDAESMLGNSPLVKMFHQQLLFAFTVGIALWIGGTVYAGIKLKSIHENAEEFRSKLAELESKSTEAEARLRQYLDTRTVEASKIIDQSVAQVSAGRVRAVTDISKSARGVRGTANSVILELGSTAPGSHKARVADASRSAVTFIASERTKAEHLLNVKKLPDLRVIQRQVHQLEKSGGRLNLWSLRAFVGNSFWVLIGICLICAVTCIAMWRSVRSRGDGKNV